MDLLALFKIDDDPRIRSLRITLLDIRTLIDKAERWCFVPGNLFNPLVRLKDAAYDASDLIDEYDYNKLLLRIEGELAPVSQLFFSPKSKEVLVTGKEQNQLLIPSSSGDGAGPSDAINPALQKERREVMDGVGRKNYKLGRNVRARRHWSKLRVVIWVFMQYKSSMRRKGVWFNESMDQEHQDEKTKQLVSLIGKFSYSPNARGKLKIETPIKSEPEQLGEPVRPLLSSSSKPVEWAKLKPAELEFQPIVPSRHNRRRWMILGTVARFLFLFKRCSMRRKGDLELWVRIVNDLLRSEAGMYSPGDNSTDTDFYSFLTDKYSFRESYLNPSMGVRDVAHSMSQGCLQASTAQRRWSRLRNFVRTFLHFKGNVVKHKTLGHELESYAAGKLVAVQKRLEILAAELRATMNQLDLGGDPEPGDIVTGVHTGLIFTDTKVTRWEEEMDNLVDLLLQFGDESGSQFGNSSEYKRRRIENVNVLTMVGAGGIGKTTLAHAVYNDWRVEHHFELKIWLCFSEFSNVRSLTKEIMESLGGQNKYDRMDLNFLQESLKEKVILRRFFLVLDNMPADWDTTKWEEFCGPLRYGLKGSVILLITQSRDVARIVSTLDPIFLGDLSDDAYCEFFKRCAFGFENAEEYPQLQDVVQSIACKLSGSLLEAKVVGGLLNSQMDIQRWRNVMNNKLWIYTSSNDVLLGLAVSFQYLPVHLMRCVLYCSLFPKGCEFNKGFLIDVWTAQGFIIAHEEKIETDDVGTCYLLDLLSNSFLYQSPRDPLLYSVHNPIHSLAEFVSLGECFKMKDVKTKIPDTVRHLSVCTDELEMEDFVDIGSKNKLHSLAILCRLDFRLDYTINSWFNSLTNLRWLKLSYCEITELPESIGNLKHLCYLDISYTGIVSLPEELCCLYYLQILDIRECPIISFPKGLTRLVSLRKLYMRKEMFSVIPVIGKLISLQELPQFTVFRKDGHRLDELKDMIKLRGSLWIKNLENVSGKDEASKSKLHNKEFLDRLILEWSPSANSTSRYTNCILSEEVLESLKPNPNLKVLQVVNYCGGKSPSWLQMETLPCLSKLWLKDCFNIREIPYLPPSLAELHLENVGLDSIPLIESGYSLYLSELYLENCPNLTSLDFPLDLESLHIGHCEELVTVPTERFEEYTSLEKLEIENCPKLTCPTNLTLPSSMRKLVLNSCGDLDRSIPDCLQNLTSLTNLELRDCLHVTSLPVRVLEQLTALKCLTISNFKELRNLDGLLSLSSLKELYLSQCPKLTDTELAVSKIETQGKVFLSLEILFIDNSALVNLLGLRNPPPSIRKLEICNSLEIELFRGERGSGWLQRVNLREICFRDCPSLKSLPGDMCNLSSLEILSIFDCPEIESMPKKGLPASLRSLYFQNCHPMLTKLLEYHQTVLKNFNRSNYYGVAT